MPGRLDNGTRFDRHRHAEHAGRGDIMIDRSDRVDDAADANGLMLAFQSGENGAFDELFFRYRSFVFALVYRIVEDPRLAEDITQIVFLKIWRSPRAFRAGGSLAAWISRVSRNCALDEVRRRRSFGDLADVAADGMTPFECVAAAMEARRLVKALAALTPAQRSLIELSFFMELTHLQIADRTGIPLGTVKTRIRAGLRALRRTLDDEIAKRTDVMYMTHGPYEAPPVERRAFTRLRCAPSAGRGENPRSPRR